MYKLDWLQSAIELMNNTHLLVVSSLVRNTSTIRQHLPNWEKLRDNMKEQLNTQSEYSKNLARGLG